MRVYERTEAVEAAEIALRTACRLAGLPDDPVGTLREALRESEAREAALVAGLRGRLDMLDQELSRYKPEGLLKWAVLATSEEAKWLCALLHEHEQRREQRQGGTTA